MAKPDPPIVLGPFIIPVSTIPGHEVRLIVASAAPEHLARLDGQDVRRPWLKGACSCGWVSPLRFTLEDNAFHTWNEHAHDIAQGRALMGR